MSRTFRGSKGPGWEPWSNRHERQQPLPDKDDELAYQDYLWELRDIRTLSDYYLWTAHEYGWEWEDID